jgi:hypothetical protein
MDDTISYLANHGVMAANANSTHVGAKYGMLWIDVEGTQVIFSVSFKLGNKAHEKTLSVSSTGLPPNPTTWTSSRRWLMRARRRV